MATPILRKVIKASAGTGKTYQLSLEYLALLLQGVPFDSILVITFTRKATAEIRSRVFSQLRLLWESPDLAETKTLYRNLQSLLPTPIAMTPDVVRPIYEALICKKHLVRIETIDGFIHRLFSELIAPYMRLTQIQHIDEKLNEALIQQVLYTLLTQPTQWAKLRTLLEQMPFEKDEARYTELLKALIGYRWWIDHLPVSLFPEFVARELGELRRLWDDLLEHLESTGGTWSSILKSGWDWVAEYRNQTSLDGFHKHVRQKFRVILRQDFFWMKKNIKDSHAELLGKFNDFKHQLAIYWYQHNVRPYMVKLLDVAKLVHQEYDHVKYRHRAFTYTDILDYTLRYLYDDELSLIDPAHEMVQNQFYERLTQRIRYVLIDEFQDTSVLQWRVLAPLITENISDETSPGGVIAVGDEKQAIYGWRGGEMALLSQLPDILQTEDTLHLTTSYRSTPLVIQTINRLFEPLSRASQSLSHFKWHYDAVESARQSEAGYVRFEIMRYGQSEDDPTKRLVHLVKEALDNRTIEPHETVIIVRKNSEMANIAAYCQELGIDVVEESASSILDYPAIAPIVQLLVYLRYADFSDLLGFLRSDLMGLSSLDVAKILQRVERVDRVIQGDLKSLIDIHPMIRKMDEFIATVDIRQPLYPLILHIIRFFDIPGFFSSVIDGKNLQRFLDRVNQFCSNSDGQPKTLAELLDYMTEQYRTEAFRQVGLGQREAIQLMTIHKSKGLEFENVFFYWDVAAPEQSSRGLTLLSRFDQSFRGLNEAVLFSSQDRAVIETIPEFDALLKYDYEKDILEEMNEIYVALTRSKSQLYVVPVLRRKLADIQKLSNWSYQRSDDRYFIFSEMMKNVVGDDLKGLEETAFEAGQPAVGSSPPKMKLPGSDLDTLKPYFNTQTEAVRMTMEVDKQLPFAREQAIIGQIRGNIVHEYLSHIYHNRPEEIVQAKSLCLNLYGEFIHAHEWDALFSGLQAFTAKHPNLFTPNGEIFTEYTLFDRDSVFRLDRLMIDISAKRIHIVDYKTGDAKNEKQLTNYKRIVNELPFVKDQGYTISAEFIEVVL